MKIYIAGDHAGFELKEKLKPFIAGLGHEVVDMGPFKFDPADDYPDFVIPAGRKIANKPSDEARAVIVAGSGQGEIIAANRIPGVRAAVYYGTGEKIIKASRDHNDSNMFCVGARFISEEEAKTAVKIWLETPFSNDERHIRRLRKIDEQG